jgi:plasmid stabilization system protein ParE
MRRFRVEFTHEAKSEIARSFEWGRQEWGSAAAVQWYRKLRSQTREILSNFPLSQPIAPENGDFSSEIRQMIFGRYRVLFEIDGRVVRILHVRGSYVEKGRDEMGVDE